MARRRYKHNDDSDLIAWLNEGGEKEVAMLHDRLHRTFIELSEWHCKCALCQAGLKVMEYGSRRP